MCTDLRLSRGANILASLLLSLLISTSCVAASPPLGETTAQSLTAPSGAQAPVQQRVDTDSAARDLRGLTPRRLIIPKLHLDAPILPVGADASGAMLAPQIGGPSNPVWSSVYWWGIGAEPGQRGNAVIAGHVNKPDGSPSTFTHLNMLEPGDKVEVITQSGRVLTFTVRQKNTPLVYVRKMNDPTMGRIFGPSLTPNLNLMTCWGEWDGKEYNRRLVVYTTLDGPSPFPIPEGLANVVHG